MQKNCKSQYSLKFNEPGNRSAAWESALPIGNMMVGALVQGGVRNERILLTDARAEYNGVVGVLPDVTDKLKEVRSFMAGNNPVMAGSVFEKAFVNKKYTPAPELSFPIADLVINQFVSGETRGYEKVLNMESAEAMIKFSCNQTVFERNAFVAYDSGLIYVELSKSGAEPIAVSLSVVPHDKNSLIFDGTIANIQAEPIITVSGNLLGVETEIDGKVYGAMSRVFVDAKAVIDVTQSELKIENAEKILIISKTYVGKTKEKLLDKVKQELLGLRQVSYDKAFKTHIAAFVKGFPRAEIRVNKEKDQSVEALIAENCQNSIIYEKLFNYAKYISHINEGVKYGFPKLTGLWGTHYQNTRAVPATSTGLAALYSAANIFGEDEKVYELINYFLSFQDDLKKNAFRIYKSRGFMVPEKIVFNSALPASIDASDLSTITGGAVLANMMYDYFLFTKDIKFLKSEALPFMTGVADFYLNYFYKVNGELMSVPSFSPNGKSKFFERKSAKVYQNSTADFVVARALINNIMNVQNIYSVNVEKIVEYQNFLNSIPALPLEKNAIREFRAEENSLFSAGTLMLYNAYATKEINHFSNPMATAPFINTIISKVDNALFSQGLVSVGNILLAAISLGQSGIATELTKFMVNNYLSPNFLFLNEEKNMVLDGTVDNFFNIAGNMQLALALVESMVLSFGNNISIMPAKLHDWKEGGVQNIPTRQNALVDIDFDDKRGNMTITIKATKQTRFNLLLPKGVKKVKNQNIDPANPRIENISLSAGKSVSFDIKY